MKGCPLTTVLRDGLRHFVFGDRWVIRISFGSSSSGKSQSFIEENGRFVVARDHQLQDTRFAPGCPFENLIYQQSAYALLTVCGGCPHGNELCSHWIVLVEKCASNAACNFAVQRQESDPSLTVHSFGPCEPLRVRKLRFSFEGGDECMRGILQCTQANSFEDKGVPWRDWRDSDQQSSLRSPQNKHD